MLVGSLALSPSRKHSFPKSVTVYPTIDPRQIRVCMRMPRECTITIRNMQKTYFDPSVCVSLFPWRFGAVSRLFQRVLVCFHFFSNIVILGLTLDKGENVPLHQGDLVTRHDGRPWEIRLQFGRLAVRERCSVYDELSRFQAM